MQATPYKLINSAERVRLEKAVTDVAQDWSKHWLQMALAAPVECLTADVASSERSGPYQAYVSDGAVLLHAATASSLLHTFATQTFGASVNHVDPSANGPSHLLREVFQLALLDLASRFRDAVGVGEGADVDVIESAPDARVWRRGSGAALVKYPLGDESMVLVLSAPLVRDLLATKREKTFAGSRPMSLMQCVESRSVTLQAWVGEAEIDLGLLHSLTSGDVIELDTHFQEPLQVSLPGISAAANAYLGHVAGRRSIQLKPSF